jgi:FlaA1/EpsC-like NDP-sugar epimerase
VELIEHAVLHAESGDTVIPKLISMKLADLMAVFSERYGKPVIVTGLRPGEKMLESLISETQSMRLVNGPDGYMYIKPPYKHVVTTDGVCNYNSHINPLDIHELIVYLNEMRLLPS